MPKREGMLLGRTCCSLLCHRSHQTIDSVGKAGYPLKLLSGNSELDIKKLPSKMLRKKTDQKFRGESFDQAELFFKMLKHVEKEILGFYPMATEC